MSLYLAPKKRVYLIDIHKLGTEAFTTINSKGKPLKFILESSVILKVLFDVRHDSDALFSYYGISVDGIRDVQLMEIGTRKGPKDFLAGLSKCVERDSTISVAEKKAWELTKSITRRLFDPAFGGRYDIFNERPIQPMIVKYCAGDVTLLPDLFNTYNAKLCQPGNKFWELHVSEATQERIKLSQSPSFDGTSNTNARGPWDKEFLEGAINQQSDDIPDNALIENLRMILWADIFNGPEEFDDWEDDGISSTIVTMITAIQTRNQLQYREMFDTPLSKRSIPTSDPLARINPERILSRAGCLYYVELRAIFFGNGTINPMLRGLRFEDSSAAGVLC